MVKVAVETLSSEMRDLVTRVEAGEVVELERNGIPVARLGPLPATPNKESSALIPAANPSAGSQPSEASVPAGVQTEYALSPAARALLELRRGVTLGGLDWKELRDEGRR